MNNFKSNILSIYGEQGKKWLNTLPFLVEEFSINLGLSYLKEVPNLTYNYVLSGFQDGNHIILKLGLDNEGLKQEAFTLKCFAGYGAVHVLAEDDGMLLLERAVPGASLKSYFPDKEQESIKIACSVMEKLHQANIPETHHFPHIKDWVKALDKDWNIPHGYLEKARRLAGRLLNTAHSNTLLHGDLHHDNILKNNHTWVVIDPKGIIGPPINEVWAFVENINVDASLIAHYFGFNEQDVFDWYFVHLVLAACWNLEDHLAPGIFIELAEKAYHRCSFS
jgi:streptomycin 6-kinase